MIETELQQYGNGPDTIMGTNNSNIESDQGETEDEEVKRNCIMGQSGLHDSDFSDSEIEGDDEDDGDDVEDEEQEEGEPVKFVTTCGQIPNPRGRIYKPTPLMPKLATHPEENDGDSTDDTDERESANGRGVGLDLTDTNDELNSSSSDEEDGPDDDDDDVDDEEEEEDEFLAKQEEQEQSDLLNTSSEEKESENYEDDEGDDLEEENDSDKQEQGNYLPIDLTVEEPDASMETKDEVVVDQEDQAGPGDDEVFAVLVGASGASVDEKWTWSKQKRVLSSNTLATLNREAGRNADSPKRMRPFPPAATEAPTMPELSLGLAALDQQIQPLPRQHLMRDDSPVNSSDEEEDKMLSEELEEKLRGSGGDNSPIPLLTPPQSPRRDDDDILSSIELEWPSNLVIDVALMNTATEVRPLSPASLQTFEEEEEKRLRSHDVKPSSLTPLLRSIQVGTA